MSCLSCSTIFWTAEYNSPRTFCLADYSVVFHDRCAYPLRTNPLTINTAYKLLGATLRTYTLPFLIPVDKLVLYRGQHHLLLFAYSSSPCGLVSTHSFLYTCFIVTTTGLISDRTLTGLSRLVYMNHCWRSCVGLPPLGVSPHLFFLN